MNIFNKDSVYLTQTDTTIGFVSKSPDRLSDIKQRPPHKHYIKALPSLQQLKSFTRVPQIHKNRVRRSKKTSFIFPNTKSYRVIKDTCHAQLLVKLGWVYTTSANLSGEEYCESFAIGVADIIIKSPNDSVSNSSSKLMKLNNTNIKRLR